MDGGVELAKLAGELGAGGAGAAALWTVFGPTLKLFGSTLRGMAEPFSQRLISIAERAERKLGDDADEDGQVSPRILQRVLTDGVFTDDPVAHEYYAGLVAGSRSEDGEDDSAIPMTQLLTRLSTAEIRLHYLIYRAIFEGLRGGWQFTSENALAAAAVYLPSSLLDPNLSDGELGSYVGTLARESLVDRLYSVGPPEALSTVVRTSNGAAMTIGSKTWTPPEDGIIVRPFWSGLELAVRAEASPLPPQNLLYIDEVTSIPAVEFEARAAVFHTMTTDVEWLDRLRRSAGHLADYDGPTGWALPNGE